MRLRALAVSSRSRLAALPEVLTLGELGYAGMEDYVWIERDIDERLIALGFEPHAAPLAETARFVRETGAKAE